MKIAFLTFLLTISFAFSAAAQKTVEPRTVTDFYMQLPADFVDDSATAERRKRIAVEDIKSGYLKLKPTEEQGERGYTEIALFKKSAGGYVVAVASIECTDNCIGGATFLERRADRWLDVSNRVYPTNGDGELEIYKRKKTAAHRDYDATTVFWTTDRLPREGRTVRTTYTGEGAAKEFEIFSATWNGERFVPDEPLPASVKAPVAVSDAVLRAADAAWKPFFTKLQAAIKRRDRKILRPLMSGDFHYNCCDESYPDNRTGAFTTWDGFDPKDYQGWRDLERELRTQQIYDTQNYDAEPLRFLGSASSSSKTTAGISPPTARTKRRKFSERRKEKRRRF